jgi:hypothetical protein
VATIVYVNAELVAVHLACDLCGDTTRIPAREPLADSIGHDARAWAGSHYAPRLVDVEVSTTASHSGNENPVS